MLENNSSMEGLEQQIMAAVESPSQQNTKMIDKRRRKDKDQVNDVDDEEFQFDSREDSFAAVEFQNDEDKQAYLDGIKNYFYNKEKTYR